MKQGLSGKRFAELDGTRGVAIALTIVCNTVVWGSAIETSSWETLANGGWVGVQLFFVLSGFLITRILVDAKGEPYYFRNFFIRRALRILPAYFLVLGLLTVALWVVGRGLPHRSLCYWLFVSNLCIAKSGYWGEYLGITWSLSVEEHFYLVWPVLVVLMTLRRLLVVTCLMIASSLVLRFLLGAVGAPPIAIYTLTPTRLDSLAAGALIAIVARSFLAPSILARWARWMVAIGGTFIVATALKSGTFNYDHPLVQTLGYTAVTIAAAGLVMLMVTESDSDNVLRRVMRWKPLVALGFYSYGIYLYHSLIYSLIIKLGPFQPSILASFPGGLILGQLTVTSLVAVSSFILAYVSYHVFERKCLDLRRHFRMRNSTLHRLPTH